ncbi:hypothetical protein HYV43_06345 [Candidatus Micrarchaeota archaeon]|nr:hypothetical protein [Candidatus Micrarchaeota archaeon]
MERTACNDPEIEYRAVRILGFAVLFAFVLSSAPSAANVTLNSPADGVLLSALNVSFSYATDLNATSCSLYANASGWSSVFSTASVTSLSYAFGSDAQYLWAIACTDGNQTVFSDVNRTFRIDSTPPSMPSGLNASGSPLVNLSWTASVDTSAVTYELSRNGTLVYNGSGLSFSENVPASTTYNYSLRAVDAAGWSSAPASVLVSGPAATVVLSNFTVAATSSTATVSWTASPAANASITYGTGATSLTVSSSFASTSASLPLAGLSAATTYSYNATACAATCTTVSGTFRTLPSSYPSPSQIGANGSATGTLVRFSAYWSDSLNLSYYVFSSNASGAWANATYTFNGSYSNHSLTLPSTAVTVAWLFYANNSQNAQNATALQSLSVIVPTSTATPVPTVTATPAPTAVPSATAMPTIPPELLHPTATPQPTATAQPTPQGVADSSAPAPTPASITATLAGIMGDLVLDAANADFALSPTGLVIGVNASKADVVLFTNFTNQGDELTIQLEVDLNGSSGAIQLSSQPTTVETGRMRMLETVPQAVTPGEYDVVGKIVAVDSGQVLDQKSLKLRVASTYAPSSDTPALTGFLVVLLAVSAVLAGQLNSVKKEFA